MYKTNDYKYCDHNFVFEYHKNAQKYNDNIENCSELATMLLDTLFDVINDHQGEMDNV